jgi:hypothetical protein
MMVMGLAAPVLPDQLPDGIQLPPGVDPQALECFREEWKAFFLDVRQTRPADGTEEEAIILKRMATFLGSTMQLLGFALLDLQRFALRSTLADLLRREADTADLDKKFALRR